MLHCNTVLYWSALMSLTLCPACCYAYCRIMVIDVFVLAIQSWSDENLLSPVSILLTLYLKYTIIGLYQI